MCTNFLFAETCLSLLRHPDFCMSGLSSVSSAFQSSVLLLPCIDAIYIRRSSIVCMQVEFEKIKFSALYFTLHVILVVCSLLKVVFHNVVTVFH